MLQAGPIVHTIFVFLIEITSLRIEFVPIIMISYTNSIIYYAGSNFNHCFVKYQITFYKIMGNLFLLTKPIILCIITLAIKNTCGRGGIGRRARFWSRYLSEKIE